MKFSVISIKSFEDEPFVYGLYEKVNFKFEVELHQEDFRKVLSGFDSLNLSENVFYFVDYAIMKIVFYGSHEEMVNLRRQVEDLIILS